MVMPWKVCRVYTTLCPFTKWIPSGAHLLSTLHHFPARAESIFPQWPLPILEPLSSAAVQQNVCHELWNWGLLHGQQHQWWQWNKLVRLARGRGIRQVGDGDLVMHVHHYQLQYLSHKCQGWSACTVFLPSGTLPHQIYNDIKVFNIDLIIM